MYLALQLRHLPLFYCTSCIRRYCTCHHRTCVVESRVSICSSMIAQYCTRYTVAQRMYPLRPACIVAGMSQRPFNLGHLYFNLLRREILGLVTAVVCCNNSLANDHNIYRHHNTLERMQLLKGQHTEFRGNGTQGAHMLC